ncbi:hypothetical protein LJR153_007105 [Paenibacillus sp. LjRoot153]|uniref:hypothetical protein n=1 Tax=Paenibacillus sp. LjRoot153 TaxID=3342270 RepID=UPI003ECE4844
MSNSYGISGYEAGRGRTFTPTVNADWINEFNTLMVDLGKSRNELTEVLIREGLQARNRGFEQLDFMSSQEIEFIKTPVGRKVLQDYTTLFFGKEFAEQHFQQQNKAQPHSNNEEHRTLSTPIKDSEKNNHSQNNEQINVESKELPIPKTSEVELDSQKAMLLKIQAELSGMKLKKA